MTDPTTPPLLTDEQIPPPKPYATSVTWRNDNGGSWQQWHDDDDPMPDSWGDRPPNEIVHVYTADQMRAYAVDQMRAYAAAVRAPLLADIERLTRERDEARAGLAARAELAAMFAARKEPSHD